jgi:nucleoside-diphosphate-sugar epimerase
MHANATAVPSSFSITSTRTGRVNGGMTEETPYNLCSRKGEVRARIATMLMDEVKRGELRATIVRSADFYGPGAVLSVTHATVTERLKAGKTPQWIANGTAVHTLTYTLDAGRSLALIGNTPSAYGQVWHAATNNKPSPASSASGSPASSRAGPTHCR